MGLDAFSGEMPVEIGLEFSSPGHVVIVSLDPLVFDIRHVLVFGYQADCSVDIPYPADRWTFEGTHCEEVLAAIRSV